MKSQSLGRVFCASMDGVVRVLVSQNGFVFE